MEWSHRFLEEISHYRFTEMHMIIKLGTVLISFILSMERKKSGVEKKYFYFLSYSNRKFPYDYLVMTSFRLPFLP